MYKIYRFIYILLILKYYISCWWCRTMYCIEWWTTKLLWIMTSKECVRKVRGPSQNNIPKLKRRDSTVSRGTGCRNRVSIHGRGCGFYPATTSRPNAEIKQSLTRGTSKGKKGTERENHSYSQSAEVKRTCGASTSLSHTPSWHRV